MTTFSPASGTHGARRCLASRLLHCPLTNGKGEAIGTIEDPVLDRGERRIRYAVVSFDDVPAAGTKYFAMPWPLIDIGCTSVDEVVIAPVRATMSVARETMIAAPGFDQDHWPDVADGRWSARQEAHYRPDWAAAPADTFDANGHKRIDAGRPPETPPLAWVRVTVHLPEWIAVPQPQSTGETATLPIGPGLPAWPRELRVCPFHADFMAIACRAPDTCVSPPVGSRKERLTTCPAVHCAISFPQSTRRRRRPRA